jgi:alkylation response protein AidB-like acyl-CoA dehydrogenase
VESATYRTAGQIDAVKATGETIDLTQPAFLRGIEELAVECSILKVACSETLYYVADEALQIHGGYGFTEEYTPARATRDARINRIFEGTNEINRLFISSTLYRRAQRGRFDFPKTVPAPIPAVTADMTDLQKAGVLWQGAKQVALMLAGAAAKKFGKDVGEEQEVLAAISDLISDIFLGESALLRTQKAIAKGRPAAVMTDLTLSLMNEAVGRMEQRAAAAWAALASGAELDACLKVTRKLLAWTPLNAIEIHRRVAKRLCEVGSYPVLIGG